MLPRWHILLGALFGLFLWLVWPQVPLYGAIIVFIASVFIDFDHYLVSVCKTGKWGLFDAFEYYRLDAIKAEKEFKKGIRRKADLQIFHTVEAHIFILILGLIWHPVMYVFAGMAFHSAADIIFMASRRMHYRREYWLFRGLKNFSAKN